MTVRIAMWSGPRNISTALMRAWENRPDTTVHDEPLYAHYLHQTGLPHPGAADIIAAQPTDWRDVAAHLIGPVPGGHAIYYQKHMTHHLLPHIEREWVLELANAFLIRQPAEVLISLAKVLPDATIDQTGIPQQHALFQYIREQTGIIPPVIDARDVLEDPRRLLSALCKCLGVPFTEAMLSWPPGPRPTDGVWAPHWYASVEKSTGFQPYTPPTSSVPPQMRPMLDRCNLLYEELAAHRLS